MLTLFSQQTTTTTTDNNSGQSDPYVSFLLQQATQKSPMLSGSFFQSILFFFAGYETVSTTLSMVSYALAAYPEVQKKVQEEIDEISPGDEPVTYDAVCKMEYLDKVWCEAIRMWPVAPL